MAKIKQFFNNILTVIGNFFAMIGRYIQKGFAWLGNTKAMQAVGKVVFYLPRKLNDKLRNDQRNTDYLHFSLRKRFYSWLCFTHFLNPVIFM